MLKSIFFAIALFSIISFCNAQVKKYKAVITISNTEFKGNVYVNLSDENKGLIKIEADGLVPDSNKILNLIGFGGKINPAGKVNAGLISRIIIGNDTFYRQDLSVKDEIKKDCFVKWIAGKKDVKLYEFTGKGPSQYYVSRREDEPLENVDQPMFNDWSYTGFSAFRKCKVMHTRFVAANKAKEQSPLYNITSIDEKIAVWKKLIEEYDNCELKN
jgi:hypothetical protein